MSDGFSVYLVATLPIFTGEEGCAVATRRLPAEGDNTSPPRPSGPTGRGMETPLAWLQGFTRRESETDNAELVASGVNRETVVGHQHAVIQGREDSDGAPSAQSTGNMDPQAPGWTKRVRVGSHPLYRTPSPSRVGALEQTRRGYAQKLGEHVVEPALGLTFDSLGEAYGFYNLYSCEHGFGIRYGKSRQNGKCREDQKCMQEIVCGCSVWSIILTTVQRWLILSKEHAKENLENLCKYLTFIL